jgi:hypothetical protein
MKVLSLIEYQTRGDYDDAHYKTHHIVKGIKGDTYKGYADLTIGGKTRRLDAKSPDLAIAWAAEHLGKVIIDSKTQPRGTLFVVPIPGHRCTKLAHVESHRLFKLATALAAWITKHGEVRAIAKAMLHWSHVVPSAHAENGWRDPYEALPFYRAPETVLALPRDSVVMLLDDVVTSGCRLRAAHHYLTKNGVKLAKTAFAIARSTQVPDAAFKPHIEEYEPLEDED